MTIPPSQTNQSGVPHPSPDDLSTPLGAVTHLYHTFFTGLILKVVTQRGADDAARWLEAVFRHQHEEKFLASFDKLGLQDKPHAVAAAAYHYLSNRVGGVDVEFMRENDRKAWVRFPPPRWVYPGAAICGIPSEVSRAMLRGWYAQNGVSLNNPRLGFVCTGQTVDGQPGLMGYFQEFDAPLGAAKRLQFRPGETPPPFDPAAAPELPSALWPVERLVKARRNYAMEYLRSGLPKLLGVFGIADGLHLGRSAAWLIGAQVSRPIAQQLNIAGDDAAAFQRIITAIVAGEGDTCSIETHPHGFTIHRTDMRLTRGLGPQPDAFLQIYTALLEGLLAGHNRFMQLYYVPQLQPAGSETHTWHVGRRA